MAVIHSTTLKDNHIEALEWSVCSCQVVGSLFINKIWIIVFYT